MADNTQQDTVRQSAEAVQASGRATGETLRRGGQFAADATRRAGEAGSDALDRGSRIGSENIRRRTQELADSQQQIIRDTAEQFEEFSHKVAQAFQGVSEDVRSLIAFPGTARGGLQDWQQGVNGLIEGVVRTNLRATQELFRLANPAAFVELQHRFVREYLDAFIENSAILVRAVRRTADETLGPLEQQINQRRSARHHQGQAQRQAAE